MTKEETEKELHKLVYLFLHNKLSREDFLQKYHAIKNA